MRPREELQEVIEFLKDPKNSSAWGKIPKGFIGGASWLENPAGQGSRRRGRGAFFSISGSDFVEMFVGVGASRVRDLFEQGRKASKSIRQGAIIFIDEIDAVGDCVSLGLAEAMMSGNRP